MNYICLIIFLNFFGSTTAWFFGGPEWNHLNVKWGFNPFKKGMPLTESAAKDAGFERISACDTSPSAKFRGSRWVKDGDESLILLYGKNGHIAGIQTGLKPRRGVSYTPPFVKMGSSFYLTAYFVQPASICSTGRTDEEVEAQGTGTMLLIQNGPYPDTDYQAIPQQEEGLSGKRWVQGKCFWTMGMHYWYDISEDMSCDDFYPVFLLYNQKRLNGFGWALQGYLSSPHFEHPRPKYFHKFMETPPKCLYAAGKLSTQHIFLTKWPVTNFC